MEKGEILGLLGPNGAGKTTTMNMICGYISMSGGSVLINGVDILENAIEAKKMIGYLPEQPPLYMEMTVWEYLNFVYELKKVRMNIPKKEHLEDVMHTVSLSDVKHRKIKNLSKGYRQRVGFAQALIGKPEVLILDEPTVGLDPNQIVELRDVIRSLKKEHTIIFSTHILSEVEELCDRVVIINNGVIAAEGRSEDVAKEIGSSCNITLRVKGCSDEFCKRLLEIDGVSSVERNENVFAIKSNVDVTESIAGLCLEEKIAVTELRSEVPNLEKMFSHLTKKEGM